ncbi:gasdermin [Candidatus Nitrospira allomarina]|uniref:Gasdermin bGSDM n=1 Tax=Candidatus Nitrospira allomarina TaxID=3020900 RepID=A0AA96JTM7_9BACT|nr:hypothetical protein [Candidatus Nitrospira allomarina]WNM59727.1 hypothetical protein PP769_08225 [Candidatus Nitrospira allomarina]
MSRPDQSITYLKDHGYCVVRLPRSDMRPLQTLIHAGKKDLQRSGELRDIMLTGNNPLPDISVDNAAPLEISGKESSSTKLEIGLNILGNIIAALGGSKLSASAGFNRAKSLVFKFENVMEDHADINLLDQYLTTASIKADQRSVTNALIDDKVYVINSTIKTTTFTIMAKADNQAETTLDIPVIQQVASGSLRVDTSKANEGIVSYKGSTSVVFGFQAVQLIYNDATKTYTAINPLDSGQMAAKDAGSIAPNYLSLDEGVFFRVHD